MSLINFFKKEKETKKEEKPLRVKPVKKEKEVEPEKDKTKENIVKKIKEKKVNTAWKILKTPHVTEKASDLTEKNQYIFRVFPRSNKKEVRDAVEESFGVEVVSVKIINVHKKKKRLGKIEGTKPGYKKAIVEIKKGQKIEVLPR